MRRVLIAVGLAIGCRSGDATEAAAAAAAPAPGAAAPAQAGEAERMVVKVDPRVELFSMLFRAAENPSYVPPFRRDTPYETAVAEKIEEIKGHPAVAATRRLFEDHSIGYNAPVGLAVYLEWPSLEPRRPLQPFPPELDERWKDVDMPAYLEQVRALVADVKLEAFFAAQEPYWTKVESSLAAFVEPYAVAPWFAAVFDDHQTRHVLIQGLLTGTNNYGANVELENGDKEAYQVVVVWNADEAGVPRPDEALLVYVVHEGAHAHVNPRTRTAADVLRADAEPLFGKVAAQMEKHAYGQWEIMVNESLVRAVTRLYLGEVGAETAARKAAEQDTNEGFLWVGDLVQVLQERRRTAGAKFTYEDVLPDAAKVFGRWAKDDEALHRLAVFCGPINSVFDRKAKIVAPADPKVNAFARAVSGRFGMEIVDADAVDPLTSEESLIFYGSPRTDPGVAQWVKKLGWQIEKDRIRIGAREWKGKNLVLIAAHPDPDNDTRAILLYISHDAADVVEINSVHHGPTDWVLARRTAEGFEPLDKGDFPKDDDCR